MSENQSETNEKESFEKLTPYLVEQISPFLTAKTIQIIVIRQLMDFTILRTEDSRELNTVELPISFEEQDTKLFGLLLASKQKAVENRYYMELIRTFKTIDCYLPQNLCMKCPRCVLFGAVKTTGGKYNLKHRIEYSSAYSLYPFEDINEIITFNAVSEKDQTTGQALNVSHNFKPLTLFPSIITLKSGTKEELIMILKTILGAKSYGAETRIKGDVRNEILGLIGGYEELITSLELKMELSSVIREAQDLSKLEFGESINEILIKYKEKAANSKNIEIIAGDKLQNLLNTVQKRSLDENLIETLLSQALNFINKVTSDGE